MGDFTTENQESAARKGKAGSAQPKAPLGLSNADHTTFVDLLLQQAAQSAKAALAATDPKALLDTASQAVARVHAALAAYTIPASGMAPKQLFRTLDGAFMGLYDLVFALRDHKDAPAASYAATVQDAMVGLNERFAPQGWKVPKSGAEGHARAKRADKAGATVLTTGEKAKLGRMHLRAARQYILGSWEQIVEGNLVPTVIAAHNLADAMSILVDPRLAGEKESNIGEVAATDEVVSRLVMAIEQQHSAKLYQLYELAHELDALRRLIGKEPKWETRVGKPAPTSGDNKTGAGPSSQQEPAQSPDAPSNDDDRGAEPTMHKIVEARHWYKKVHIKDSNYLDEYLGYIELFVEAYKTASGQVYVNRATATKKLEGRAGQYLSMGANVVANSVDLNGQRFSDVYFDVQIGGPNKTETTAIGVGGKVTASSSDKTQGAELSATVVFSTAVSSQGTRAFRRVFRISSLSQPVKMMQKDPDTGRMNAVDTGMAFDERGDLHQDFKGFRLDDDDVGDELTSFYADWVLHSYGD